TAHRTQSSPQAAGDQKRSARYRYGPGPKGARQSIRRRPRRCVPRRTGGDRLGATQPRNDRFDGARAVAAPAVEWNKLDCLARIPSFILWSPFRGSIVTGNSQLGGLGAVHNRTLRWKRLRRLAPALLALGVFTLAANAQQQAQVYPGAASRNPA